MATAVSNFARRHSLTQILADFVKFAVGSAIDSSRKIIPGKKQAEKMVPEGLINIAIPTPLKTKKNLDKKVENELHFEKKVLEMKEDMNSIKQQYKTSTRLVEESQPPNKLDDDGFKGINLLQKNGRRVFIRSRL